jgi:hypothetical protein
MIDEAHSFQYVELPDPALVAKLDRIRHFREDTEAIRLAYEARLERARVLGVPVPRRVPGSRRLA